MADMMGIKVWYLRKFIEKMGRILPLFCNSSEPVERFSFVVTDKKAFEYPISKYAENCRIPFNVSFILSNAEKEVIGVEATLEMTE